MSLDQTVEEHIIHDFRTTHHFFTEIHPNVPLKQTSIRSWDAAMQFVEDHRYSIRGSWLEWYDPELEKMVIDERDKAMCRMDKWEWGVRG